MFDNKQDLNDFLLTNDFNDKYSDIEYKYLLMSFREFFRKLHSENQGLNRQISNLTVQVEAYKKKEENTKIRLAVNSHYINGLKEKLLNRVPWYKKLYRQWKNK